MVFKVLYHHPSVSLPPEMELFIRKQTHYQLSTEITRGYRFANPNILMTKQRARPEASFSSHEDPKCHEDAIHFSTFSGLSGGIINNRIGSSGEQWAYFLTGNISDVAHVD